MDDSYLIHEDIDHLRHCLDEIEKACEAKGITVNRKRTTITPLTKGFTFLKKRVYLEPSGRVSIRLTRKNITARRRKLRHQKESLTNGKITMETIAQSYQSWRGYAAKYDSYDTIKSMDKLYYNLFGVMPGEETLWTQK